MSTTPTTPSDPQAMPLADLKQAAGLGEPAAPEIPVATAPAAPVQPEWGQLAKNDDGTYQVTLATGEVFKGTADEVIAKQAEAHVSTKRWGQDWKQKAEATQPPPQAPVQQTPQIDPVALATAQWQRDQVDLADAYDMGITVEELRRNRRMAVESAPVAYLDNQSNQFKQMCKDWVETPENLKAMNDYFEGWKTIPNANTLRLAWLDLKDAGKVTPLAPQASAPVISRPPVMPSGGGGAPSGDQNAWTMPLDQLKQQAGLG